MEQEDENIICVNGEESPQQFQKFLELFITGEKFVIQETEDPCIYMFINKEYSFTYIICDESSNKTSPDYYIETNKGNKYFIEETECLFSDSGNNSQYQRATKFLPKIYSKDILKYYIIGDCSIKITNNNMFALKLWKTTNIELVLSDENSFNYYKMLKPFSSIQEIIDWNDLSNIMIFENNEITFLLNIFGTKFNLAKSGKSLESDPNKGCLSLVLLAIINLIKNGKKPKIIFKNLFMDNIQIPKKNTGNKIIRTFKHLKNNGFELEFVFDNEITFDIDCYHGYIDNTPFNIQGSKSEKIIGIRHIVLLSNEEKCLFENHARTTNKKILTEEGNRIPFKKSIKKPDIIIKNNRTTKTSIIESELFENIKKGQEQINKWITHIETYNFYKNECKYKNMEIYLELYDRDNKFNGDFQKKTYKNVKYILNKKGNLFVNVDFFEPLYFNF